MALKRHLVAISDVRTCKKCNKLLNMIQYFKMTTLKTFKTFLFIVIYLHHLNLHSLSLECGDKLSL